MQTQFATVTEIEATINSRHLTAVDAKVGIQLVTPNDFLQVQYLPTNFKEDVLVHTTTASIKSTTIYKHANEALCQFWDI